MGVRVAFRSNKTTNYLAVSQNADEIFHYRLTVWFFLISAFAHVPGITRGRLQFSMTWYSFIFPNTALVTATLAVGKSFASRAIQIVGTTLAVILIVVWLVIFGMMIRAIYRKQILWPQKGEDIDETSDSRRQRSSSRIRNDR